jgi:hypothetical protein
VHNGAAAGENERLAWGDAGEIEKAAGPQFGGLAPEDR